MTINLKQKQLNLKTIRISNEEVATQIDILQKYIIEAVPSLIKEGQGGL
jgi:hypothetical protein